jgi:AcrR family transcriptional regulator
MREKILYVTMSDVSRVGPAAFNVGVVCEALQISNSLINHHFGGRDELIAEAVVETYQRYVEDIWMTAIAQVTPESRLRAWIEASVARQVAGVDSGQVLLQTGSTFTQVPERAVFGTVTVIVPFIGLAF